MQNIPFEVVDIIFSFVPSLGYHINHKLDAISLISWNAYMTAEDIIRKFNRYHRNTRVTSDYYRDRWETHYVYGFFIISEFSEMNDYPIDAFMAFPKNVTNVSKLLEYITTVDQLLFIKKTVHPTMMYEAIDDCRHNDNIAIREKILEIYLSKDNHKKDSDTIRCLAYGLVPSFSNRYKVDENLEEIIEKLSILVSKQ